jgi:hypothetical protein
MFIIIIIIIIIIKSYQELKSREEAVKLRESLADIAKEVFASKVATLSSPPPPSPSLTSQLGC